ncbi:hypothetical protein BGW39_010356 [Mortierella sp. 14UC]|nr:hypothetical protein BGW39_010356 [Mortierella sp. 14UC]
MAAQGRLNLDCIAADSGSTYLYGIASADGPNGKKHIVLVKSNYSPSSLADVTWTVISSTPGDELSYHYPRFTSIDCAVSNSGAFSAFFRSSSISSTRIYNLHPMGVRYDPVMGEWFGIKGSRRYGWVFDNTEHKSFYFGDKVVHAIHDHGVIHFGIVDTELNMLQYASFWRDMHGLKLDLDPGWTNQNMYGYYNHTRRGFFSLEFKKYVRLLNFGDNIGDSSGAVGGARCFYGVLDRVDSYIFDSPVDAPLLDLELNYRDQVKNESLFHFQYQFNGMRENHTFIALMGGNDEPKKLITTELRNYTQAGWNTTTSAHNLTRIDITNIETQTGGNYSVSENFVTVGGRLAGQEPFAVALTTDGLYEFGLFGNNTAGVMKGPFHVNIPAAAGFNSSQPQQLFSDVLSAERTTFWLEPNAVPATILGIPAFVAMVMLCRWWSRRREVRWQNKLVEKAEQEMNTHDMVWFKDETSKTTAAAEVDEPEVYVMGIIHEDQVPERGSIGGGGGGGGGATEGILNLDCIATDPSSRYLYSLVGTTGTSPGDYADSYAVLVRSNFNPTSLANVTWSILLYAAGTVLSYNYPTFTSVDCAAADNSTFTAFVRSSYRILPNTAAVPMGFSTPQRLMNDRISMGLECFNGDSFSDKHKTYLLNSDYNESSLFNYTRLTNCIRQCVQGCRSKNQSYAEHNFIHSDTTTDFTVHENFQTVDGKLQGQFPFVVALTSKGLYEFGIFGPEVGKMKGPYNVMVDGFNNLPSRVVTTYTDRTQQSESLVVAMFSILGGIVLALIMAFGVYARIETRHMKKLLDTEKKKDSSSEYSKGEQDKQELCNTKDIYLMGILPATQEPSHSAAHYIGAMSSGSGVSVDTSLSSSPDLTYQDQITDLEFSRHPRPNIVTTLGDGEGREV